MHLGLMRQAVGQLEMRRDDKGGGSFKTTNRTDDLES